jgi:hypothetical protein
VERRRIIAELNPWLVGKWLFWVEAMNLLNVVGESCVPSLSHAMSMAQKVYTRANADEGVNGLQSAMHYRETPDLQVREII